MSFNGEPKVAAWLRRSTPDLHHEVTISHTLKGYVAHATIRSFFGTETGSGRRAVVGRGKPRRTMSAALTSLAQDAEVIRERD